MKLTLAALKSLWIKGYVPTQTDYSNLFDSQLNITDNFKKYEITASDLNEYFIYTLNHGKGNPDAIPVLLKDNNGYAQPNFLGNFKIIDGNNISIDFGGTISGTWTLYILFLT